MTLRRRIEVIGADANNLANVNLDIPLNSLTAVVGVSGSGKSSFVEDTLAAEAAVRMRRFLDVDIGAQTHDVRAFIGELPPTLLVGQRAFRASSRTTVATSTALLRVLRRLFVRHGVPFADDIGQPVPEPSPNVWASWLSNHVAGRAIVWAVPICNELSTGARAAAKLAAAGLADAVVYSETDRGKRVETGTPIVLENFKPLRADVRHTIESRVGEVKLGAKTAGRLLELLEHAWQAADGRVFVELLDVRRRDLKRAFTFGLDVRRHWVHPDSPRVFRVPSGHLLTFNNPEHDDSGACPACSGRGVAAILDEGALVTRPDLSLHEGAFALWTPRNYRYVNIQHETIEGLRGRSGFDPDKPWSALSAAARNMILDGSPNPVEDRDPGTKRKSSKPHIYVGFRAMILERAGRPTRVGEALQAFIHRGPCNACLGTRWNEAARALRVDGMSIDRFLATPFSVLAEGRELTRLLAGATTDTKSTALWANIARIAESFVNVGLGALSGERGMLDVSDGESRRTRFAGVLNSRLAGLLLVLDEPGRGLHEADLARVGDAIIDATARHTVVMSEHRQRLVGRADYVIEMGPGAGKHGGMVVSAGGSVGMKQAKPAPVVSDPVVRRPISKWMKISGVNVHNVIDATVRLPLGALTCIAGVSGSGKSSFVRGALVPALMRALPADCLDVDEFRTCPATWRKIVGTKGVGALHALDQTPASAQPRSLVSTFLDVAESLRRSFAATPQAKILDLDACDFGTNAGRGRCQKCLGLGKADDGGPCAVCGGLRFGIDVLSVRLGGRNLAEILATPIADFEERAPSGLSAAIVRRLIELGVGHLSLGRSLDTLSGGEIQRLRVARALSRHRTQGAFFVIDEPACGLHPTDVDRLYRALRHIVAEGENTVVIIEHDPYLLANCDYIVEFGPVGGPSGGKVVAQGAPADVALEPTPTGLALSGKVQTSRATRAPRETIKPATTPAVARRARAEIRQLIGGDVEVADDGDVVRPAAMIKQSKDASWATDLADLDRAVAAVLLDNSPCADAALANLRQKWDEHPTAQLRINPLLDSIAIWGQNLPRSAINDVNRHLLAMGLGPMIAMNACAPDARASGERLCPEAPSRQARDSALLDAWAVGNGYIELADAEERVIAVASDRLLDLRSGLVGPRRPRVAHFSRRDALGRCPECHGSGKVATIDEGLFVNKRNGGVFDEEFLEQCAADILRGVRRTDMLPFFRRLADEGLWNDRPWRQMIPAERHTVLHGFWVRPGHGTFVKNGKDINGSDVRHWLRWDGLVAAVLGQLPRSKDAAWRAEIEMSRSTVTCPLCAGSGLAGHARLLRLGDRSLAEWVLNGTVAGFTDALNKLGDLPPRAARARDRIVSCLAPLRSTEVRLRESQSELSAQRVLSLASDAFVGLPLVTE